MSTRWLQGKPAPFREVYPNVKSLKFIGTQHGDLRHRNAGSLHYTESTLPSKIDCANPRCQQGGYEIQSLRTHLLTLRKLHMSRLTTAMDTKALRKADAMETHV